ncbi:methyltransferase domain-containing protein [Intrasporangium mesophilum]
MSCCEPGRYDRMFGTGFSRHLARRYRRRGLDRTAARMVEFLTSHGVEGASVLEIGGGVGDIQLELLRRGAARATSLELAGSYDADAAALADEAGMTERISRRRVDLASSPEAVEAHDIVVLHRVVCCYPDYERLLGAAADHAQRLLVFSHPPRNVLSRSLTSVQNQFFRLRGMTFRTYVHDPAAMRGVAGRGNLAVSYSHRGAAWHIVGLSSGPS